MITATAKTEMKASASLLAQIKVNETWAGRTVDDAEARSRAMFNCLIDDLTTEQAYAVLRAQVAEQPPQEPHDGYCISCGRPSSLRECIACHEGMTLGELFMRERKAALRS